MSQNRRTFLRTTALAGAAAAGAGLAAPALAQRTAAPTTGAQQLPRDLTLATLRRAGGYGLGVRSERGILDVTAAEQEFRENGPTTIEALLRGERDANSLKRLLDKASASSSAERFFVAADRAQFGPCVTNPEKIVCIGLNYRKHAAETGQPVPKQPILFNKYNTALNCCGGAIAVSKEKAEKFDYESELVIVIGRTARNVSEADALQYIFGYCTGNDFTARDLQSRSSQWMLGKTLDGCGVIGPWLVTADQINGDNLKIECRVNGELRQSSNTSD